MIHSRATIRLTDLLSVSLRPKFHQHCTLRLCTITITDTSCALIRTHKRTRLKVYTARLAQLWTHTTANANSVFCSLLALFTLLCRRFIWWLPLCDVDAVVRDAPERAPLGHAVNKDHPLASSAAVPKRSRPATSATAQVT